MSNLGVHLLTSERELKREDIYGNAVGLSTHGNIKIQ